MKKDIAIVVQNYVQFINIKPGVDELIKKGYKIDFFCPDLSLKGGYEKMFSDIIKYMKENNYNIYESPTNDEYKILLEPYPVININAKYNIKYRYGTISAKPNIVYKTETFLKYDCILCAGNYDSSYLKAFSETYITGNMKYINFKKHKDKKYPKKVLLYLPTYGDCSSIDLITDELQKLRKDYYVITKIHHGTNYFDNEEERINKLKNNVDEFYDSYKNLSELLEIADVILTDNSGSIFEAIYVETPVSIFADDINKNKLNDTFNTLQYDLVQEGIIPYTNDKSKLCNIIKESQTEKIIKKQKEWKDKNLYDPLDKVKDFVEVIEKYLNDDINLRYYSIHNMIKNDFHKLLDSNSEKDYTIKQYENGKLYKIASWIYKVVKGKSN